MRTFLLLLAPHWRAVVSQDFSKFGHFITVAIDVVDEQKRRSVGRTFFEPQIQTKTNDVCS